MSGNEEVAQLLLDYGANVSITNHKRSTPLHLASLQGNEAMRRLLLDKGAYISVPNKYGSMPLHLAATHENAVFLSGQARQAFLGGLSLNRIFCSKDSLLPLLRKS